MQFWLPTNASMLNILSLIAFHTLKSADPVGVWDVQQLGLALP